jgi:hypothetical protein
MGSTSELLLRGDASRLAENGGVILMLWIATGLAVAVVLYLVIRPFVLWYRRRRAASRASETNVLDKPDFVTPSAPVWSDYLEAKCNHCQATVFVAKVRRFKPFFCPNCSQTNPPLKKETMAWLKKFLRWLLYPSFQDFF